MRHHPLRHTGWRNYATALPSRSAGGAQIGRGRLATGWHVERTCLDRAEKQAGRAVPGACRAGSGPCRRNSGGCGRSHFFEDAPVKLIIQPDHGVAPLISQIRSATKSVDTTIFRLDLPNIEEEFRAAVRRGVSVRALVAHRNRDGKALLRDIERRLREHGIEAARSADDLLRYHGKMLITDRSVLNLMLFNYTAADLGLSRSFALVTREARLVDEALRLFEDDLGHQPYRSALDTFVVSPNNSRSALSTLIESARWQLLIYDPAIKDAAMLTLLRDRVRKGVEVRIIGSVKEATAGLNVRDLRHMRLHARVIICDGRHVFMGSQSLARTELDERREIGIIVDDAGIVGALKNVFVSDWLAAGRRVRISPPFGERNDWQGLHAAIN
jgi:cardiolipin synthase A/B